jgi:hypothetical protein
MAKKRRKSQPKGDPRLTAAVSLQEAATWVRQAETALEDLHPDHTDQLAKDCEALRIMGRNLKRIHNRYSRVKMS